MAVDCQVMLAIWSVFVKNGFMDIPKRPSIPRVKNKLGKQIEDLPFLDEIDQKLLDNVPLVSVVAFIQKDMGELTNVSPNSLSNALSARRKQIQGTATWFSADSVDGDDNEMVDELMTRINYRRKPVTPSRASSTIAEREEAGIIDMLELEALYLAQRDRCDRLMELETICGAFGEMTTKAIDSAAEILWKRIQARGKLNEGEYTGVDVNLNIRNYSRETMEVLSNPESRHRILSLVERVTRFGKSKTALPEALPLPVSSNSPSEE